jgi:hypothetical protein
MHEMEGPRPVSPRIASDCSVASACETCLRSTRTSPSAPATLRCCKRRLPCAARTPVCLCVQNPGRRAFRELRLPFAFRTQVALRSADSDPPWLPEPRLPCVPRAPVSRRPSPCPKPPSSGLKLPSGLSTYSSSDPKFPSGRSPFPGDVGRFLVPRTSRHKGFPTLISQLFLHPQDVHRLRRVVPRMTGVVHRFIHRV